MKITVADSLLRELERIGVDTIFGIISIHNIPFYDALERHGGDVIVELDGREIRIRTVDEVVTAAQTLTHRLLSGKRAGSMDAFLGERRRDADKE